jgi:hypothetical protein
MGANAVTTVPVYTAGEVLTAADMNITNSGIPVFASSVQRDAAFGGAGEKTLAEGQFAYLEDTNTTQYYDGAAWQSVSVLPTFGIFNETQASGTNSGGSTANAWTKRTLNTTNKNDITGCSIAASVITLPAGSYYVTASAPFHQTNALRIRLQNTSDATTAILGQNGDAGSGIGLTVNAFLVGYFTITASKNFELQYYVTGAVATNGLGQRANIVGLSEVYGEISIQKVA